jgi:phospholipid-binding lipoprotein MlaA
MDDSTERWILYGLRYLDARVQLFEFDELVEDAYDPYIRIREAFLQNRRFRIYDGNPPEDEDFYDDFLEEEEE